MELLSWENPVDLTHTYQLKFSYNDLIDAYGKMTYADKQELMYFGRSDASVEERLMGLQVIVRALERESNRISNRGTQDRQDDAVT